MRRVLSSFMVMVIMFSAFSFMPAFDESAVATTATPVPAPTIPAENIVINNNGAITNPYGVVGASLVWVNVEGIIDPKVDNLVVQVKGTTARYTSNSINSMPAKYAYFKAKNTFVVLVDGSVTIDDIAVVPGIPTRLICADVNLNGVTDATDINLLKGVLSRNRTTANYYEFLASDANSDGFINTTDYNLIKAWISGYWYPPIPIYTK